MLSAWARGKSDCLCLSSHLSVSPSVSDCALAHCPSPTPTQWSWDLCCYCNPSGGENWAPHSIPQSGGQGSAGPSGCSTPVPPLLATTPHSCPSFSVTVNTSLTGAQPSGWFRMGHGPPMSQLSPLAAGEEHDGEVLAVSPCTATGACETLRGLLSACC